MPINWIIFLNSWFLHSTACPIVRKPHTQQLCQQLHSGDVISGHLECTLSAILQGLMTMQGDLAVWTHHSGVHQHLTNTGKHFTNQNTKSSCLQKFLLVGLNYQTTSPIGFMQMNGSMQGPTRFRYLYFALRVPQSFHVCSKDNQLSSQHVWMTTMMHTKRILPWSHSFSRRIQCLSLKGK